MKLFSTIIICLLLVACKSTNEANSEVTYYSSDVKTKPSYLFTASVFQLEMLKLKDKDGFVTLSFIIDTDGIPKNIKVISSSPQDVFDKYAISSLKMWKYKPAIKNNQKVPVHWIETVYYGNKYDNKVNDYLLRNLSGKWIEGGSEHCSENFHNISFENGNMSVEYSDLGYFDDSEGQKNLNYKIIEFKPNYLRVQLEGETRKDTDGKSVIWHIGLKKDGNYCWSRDDWPENSCTTPRYKCKT